MATLGEVAKYVRSKNAGPFWATIDVFCDDAKSFTRVKNSQAVKQETIARVYHVDPKKVLVFALPDLNVVKVSFPRPQIQGHKYERDMHYGQQYVSLLDLEV
ncbi:MAG: DUF4387 domain-containing protein [Pseudoclavibacter sp.]